MLGYRSCSPAAVCLSLLHLCFSSLVLSQPTANLSTSWAASSIDSVSFGIGSPVDSVKPIFLRGHDTLSFAFGFVHTVSETGYLFAIFIVYSINASQIDHNNTAFPQVVWAANRNFLIANPTLELTSEGDLVLKEGDGSVAWSTNTSGKSVVGLNLTDSGNLVLFDANYVPVWQSFDYPTDSLVLGQKLSVGQKLMASVSAKNWTAQGLLSLSMTSTGLFAQMDTHPPQVYYSAHVKFPNTRNDSNYIKFMNGTLALFKNFKRNGFIFNKMPAASLFLRLEHDGHLRAYEFDRDQYCWKAAADLLLQDYGHCGYPMVCGPYGICTSNQQCVCPDSNGGTTHFKQINHGHPELGCCEEAPLSSDNSQFQNFLEIKNLCYFTYGTDFLSIPQLVNATGEKCKEACAKKGSCKTAFFVQNSDDFTISLGSCYLLSEVFSLISSDYPHNSTGYIKVQNIIPPGLSRTTSSNNRGNRKRLTLILSFSLGSIFAVVIAIGVIKVVPRKRDPVDDALQEYPDQVPGMPKRFTYNSLKVITEDFSKKLGEGGFGSVFEGNLKDGTKVAVKRLDSLGHIKKVFSAEVETIGSIHHVNLVKLVGFCTENSHRLLVYEHMSNGSLDKWIFHRSSEYVLDWQQRRKIIYDIAKGLNYLHEECRQKIVHLDIKPQNILLDGNFNAKVADFGLSKLIERDQSQIMTTMRGTPGYLAPEWLNAVITEKVDVYSFGVVVLEIVSARRVFDASQDPEDMYLVGVLRRKAEEGRLSDIVDCHSEDMRLNEAQAVNMLRIAAWCLQGDFTKRPSMSMVVKVLDGLMDVPNDLEYCFSYPPLLKTSAKTFKEEVHFAASPPPLPSVLSGPR